MSLDDFLDHRWLGNSARTWLVAAAVGAFTYLVLRLLRRYLLRRLAPRAAASATLVDDAFIELLGRTRNWFMLLLALRAGLRVALLPPRLESLLDSATVILVLLQVAVWGNGLVSVYVTGHVERRQQAGDTSSVTTIRALGILARVIVWSVLILAALDNLGFNVTTLVTGLGIGGIAIALAVQNILGDVLAALSIVFDKPFVVGDVIIVDTLVGTVEHVGIKTTRVRAITGEQIIFSNTDLLKSRVRNMKRMLERRVSLNVDVAHDTPHEQLVRIPGMLRETIEAQEAVRFDRSHLSQLGESALRFEAVYYKLDPDYAKHMDTQQAVLLSIVKQFRDEGIQFAFPTRAVVIGGAEERRGLQQGSAGRPA